MFLAAHLALLVGVTTPEKFHFDEVHHVPAARQMLEPVMPSPLLFALAICIVIVAVIRLMQSWQFANYALRRGNGPRRLLWAFIAIAFAGFAAMLPISAAFVGTSMETFNRLMIIQNWI